MVSAAEWGAEGTALESWIARYGLAAKADLRLSGVDQAQLNLANAIAPTGGLVINAIPYANIKIYEIAAWTRRLSDTECNQLGAYSFARYGV
jgi:hypothetical protein